MKKPKNNVHRVINTILSKNSKAKACDIKLMSCSPDLDVIYKDKGAICVKCSTYFKIYTSYLSHHVRCL